MLNLTLFTHWTGFNSSLFCDKIVYLDANANNWVKVFVDQLCLPSLTFSQLWIRLYRANWRAKQCSHTENCLSLRVWLCLCAYHVLTWTRCSYDSWPTKTHTSQTLLTDGAVFGKKTTHFLEHAYIIDQKRWVGDGAVCS